MNSILRPLSDIIRVFLVFFLLGAVFSLAGCAPAVSPQETPTLAETAAVPTPTMGPDPEYLDHVDRRPDIQPNFFLGVDLSYVNEMDDCGAVYQENGQLVDAYQLFSDHGAQLVRARLWIDADWTDYSDLADIKRTFHRANQAGMYTLLDFHYSDNWADPSKQAIPERWKDLSDEELIQAVYDYTYQTLVDLDRNHLMPDFVKVGNETNSGLLKQVMELDWPRDAALFNAGIRAVRDAGRDTGTDPQIILHVAQPENAGWWFRGAIENGITDFDIIGLSYYPQWSIFSIGDLGAQTSYLRETFQKEVVIVETAYLWTMEAVEETASNILNQGIRGYPFTPEGQRQFMVDLSQSLISNGGLGVVYWEPAWVSTQCSTRWGQGSHWENATFFDFNNGNEVHQGIEFLSFPYYYPGQLADGLIEDAYGGPLLVDPAGDNFQEVSHLDLLDLYAYQEGGSLNLALTVAGDIYADPWGSLLIYLDTTGDGSGAATDPGSRPITVLGPYLPEFRLDLQALARKGTVSLSLKLNAWNGTEWIERTYTGGAAVQAGSPTVIELQIPLDLLGTPEVLNLGVVSTGRGRVHTAGDVLGSAVPIADWSDPVVLDSFGSVPLDQGE
ncbi:MAG: arabinogalactan endo-beta-1,4-galactanase [Anaerolineales bacterium]